jgi:hypothetical protein
LGAEFGKGDFLRALPAFIIVPIRLAVKPLDIVASA